MEPFEFVFEKNSVYNNSPNPYFVGEPTVQHFAPEYYGRGPVYVDKDAKYD